MMLRCPTASLHAHLLAVLGVSILALASLASLVSADVASADAIASSLPLATVGKDTLGQAFASSFAMIIVSELGDKTFFIAAVLAMRQDRRCVFIGAAGAL